MATVTLQGVSKRFPGGVVALDGIDLEIADGELFALLGPSGCGKTTLLRTLAGLDTPTSGRVVFDGRDVTAEPPARRRLAMVFQDYALFPHMTVRDNIAYPLKVRRVAVAERHTRAAAAAEALALGDLLDRRPAQLSGGQQQRVALARAVAAEPTLLLLDEPLSNLDARLRLEARTFLKKLQRDLGVTTVYVTHDQSEALALADRLAVLRDGRLQQVGPPAEVYRRPASRFVAAFVGNTPMNLLEGVVAGGRLAIGPALLSLPVRLPEGERVTLGCRPEQTVLAAGDGLPGTVAVAELLGADWLVTVACDGAQVRVVTRDAPPVGARVTVWFPPEACLFYRAHDGALIEAAATRAPPATV